MNDKLEYERNVSQGLWPSQDAVDTVARELTYVWYGNDEPMDEELISDVFGALCAAMPLFRKQFRLDT